jgi:hypothetical protein
LLTPSTKSENKHALSYLPAPWRIDNAASNDRHDGRTCANHRPSGVAGLRVKLPGTRRQTGVVTLKDRTLSPLAKRFIEAAREVAKPLADAKWSEL